MTLWRSSGLVALAASGVVWMALPVSGSAVQAAGTSGRTAQPALGLTTAEIGRRVERSAPATVLPHTQRRLVHWRAGGLIREVIDVAPLGVGRPLPLVVVLHGRRQTAWRAERVEGWDRYAAAGRAIVAYGAGYGGSWNAGHCCGLAHRTSVDDVEYVLAVIKLEERSHPVDRRGVFVVGFSNGGMLAYSFACAHARVISAFAVVAGSLETGTCRPSRPLSVIDVQGDRDRVVPYAGTRFSRVAGASITSIARSLRPWQQAATGSAAVRLVRLGALGHEWPTLRRGQWDATSHLWRFLITHPAPTS